MSFAEYLASANAAQTLAYGRGGAQRLLPAGPRLGPARFTAATVSLTPKSLYQQDRAKALLASVRLPCP